VIFVSLTTSSFKSSAAPGPRNELTATPFYVLAPIDDHDIINNNTVAVAAADLSGFKLSYAAR